MGKRKQGERFKRWRMERSAVTRRGKGPHSKSDNNIEVRSGKRGSK